jgi:tRNA-2-methylthio-N6-dimethylallyladenosine synthase
MPGRKKVPPLKKAPARYHIWTEGCQMNVADSQRVASALERLGYVAEPQIERADVIVLNTCVVRQQAEEKAWGRVTTLKPLKERNPNLTINLMGCMVGVKGADRLRRKLPFVDVFSPPSDPGPLVSHLTQNDSRFIELQETEKRFAFMDGELLLPETERGNLVTAQVPVVYGCSHACTFCIIPYRRGAEHSRPLGKIVAEIRSLAAQGVKEVTLLGQIVDRYGKDVPDGPDLPALLRHVSKVDGIQRIRFLTSHPNWMSDELLETVAELPKVMPHIEVPIQAGHDAILENMKRGYTVENYRRLIARIRQIIPNVSIATDIILGFPGETDKQFQSTVDLLAELKLDIVHVAQYSEREGTVAARRLQDDVPGEEKLRRLKAIDDMQEGIVAQINARYLGETVKVLFEEEVKGRWKGRTETNKLVFAQSERDLRGQVLPVQITWTGPWSMQGRLFPDSTSIPLSLASISINA